MDSIIITGGFDSWTKVIRYDRKGQSVVLNELNTERLYHGCAQFTDSDGVQVSTIFPVQYI